MPQQYEYKKLKRVTVNITWKRLYEEIYARFFSQQKLNHEMFFRSVLPESLFNIIFDFPDQKQKSDSAKKSMIDRVFCACDGANKRFQITYKYLSVSDLRQPDPILVNPQTEEVYSFSQSPLLKEIAERWDKLMDYSAVCEDGSDINECLSSILGEISYEDELRVSDRIDTLVQDGNYSMALACMSLIACTVFSWCTSSKDHAEKNNRLYRLVLPPLPSEESSTDLQNAKTLMSADYMDIEKIIELLKKASRNPLDKGEAEFLIYKCYVKCGNYSEALNHLDSSRKCGYIPAIRTVNQTFADRWIKEARKTFHNTGTAGKSDIIKCCQNCESILQLSPSVEAQVRGEACFYLYKYSLSGKYDLPSGESPYQYLEQSHLLGYEQAIPAWQEYKSFQLTPNVEQPSSSRSVGVCFVNQENYLTDLVSKSLPVGWRLSEMRSFKSFKDAMNDARSVKFLLFDEDQSRNVKDALDILQILKDETVIIEQVSIEIYLRAVEDHVKSVVDTALSHLPGVLIPIHIIDDGKWAAQQLLSCHPLFYPIRAMNSQSGEKTLNLVVLGDSEVTDWIVREAFWMMSFRDKNIHTAITIIAPNGQEIEARIKSAYPGMASEKVNIKEVPLAKITSLSVDFESAEFSLNLERIMEQPDTYFYFVIATNDDNANLLLSKRIRELQIRSNILRRNEEFFTDLPPIAFLCRDQYTAWISRGLVIEGEELGNQWFNTWSLIPFGDYSQRYRWDSLDGGAYELLSKCLHLQYSNVKKPSLDSVSKDDETEYNKQIRPHLYDYYRRQYNRDSSYSEALSMPYRLFQFHDRYGKRILPRCWSILDGSVYSSVSGLSDLASRLSYLTQNVNRDKEYQEMSIWEHNRWIRWMLSRGWLPATPDDAVFAWKCGNKRQQLFVARLHPCLCSYDELSKLSDILRSECGMEKDFFSLDRLSIESTESLLRLEWIYPEVTKQKEDEKEQ